MEHNRATYFNIPSHEMGPIAEEVKGEGSETQALRVVPLILLNLIGWGFLAVTSLYTYPNFLKRDLSEEPQFNLGVS